MGVLPAVFTDAGQVGLNVARIVCRVVKRGCEEQDQSLRPTYQFLVDSPHGALYRGPVLPHH